MSNASSWKDADGDFLLVISGLTRFAPYLTGWQHFKDHIRKVVKEQPGWVDVYSSQSQRRGEMQGWARMRDVEDADAAYSTSRTAILACTSRLTHALQKPTTGRRGCSCTFGKRVAAAKDSGY
jgi:hypothetical protein